MYKSFTFSWFPFRRLIAVSYLFSWSFIRRWRSFRFQNLLHALTLYFEIPVLFRRKHIFSRCFIFRSEGSALLLSCICEIALSRRCRLLGRTWPITICLLSWLVLALLTFMRPRYLFNYLITIWVNIIFNISFVFGVHRFIWSGAFRYAPGFFIFWYR